MERQKIMRKGLGRKGLVVGIMILFFGASVVPSISGYIGTNNIISSESDAATIINEGSLSGYVNDTHMNHIEGVLVRVYFHETYEEDYTDSYGYYHVTNIPICWCMKNATSSKEEYSTEWVLLSTGENTTYDFVLTHLAGNTLYVGGSGPGNYTKIQDAIDDASDGDIVFVYDDSSPYFEHVIVDKSISLIGENKDTTVIESPGENSYLLVVRSDSVLINGFTISSRYSYIITNIGIFIDSSENVVTNCVVIENNFAGIYLSGSHRNCIYGNAFKSSIHGIRIENSFFNSIECNNFIDASPSFYFSFKNFFRSFSNRWISNYWDDWDGFGPQVISGEIGFFPWINFDWRPAQEPYDIPAV